MSFSKLIAFFVVSLTVAVAVPSRAEITNPSTPSLPKDPVPTVAKPEPAPVTPPAVKPPVVPEEEGELGSTPAASKIVTWEDPETESHYMYLPGARTFTRTTWACQNRGWAVFNLKYLAADEQARFFNSSVFEAVPWLVRFKGEPGEFRELKIWGSTSYGGFSSEAEMVYLRERKIDERRQITLEKRAQGGIDDGLKLASICMFRGEHWFRCSADQVCKNYDTTTTPGQPVYYYRRSTWHTPIEEAGETEAAAKAWVTKTGTYTIGAGQRSKRECTIDVESYRCEQDR